MIALLVAALYDPNELVCWGASSALGTICDPRTLSELEHLAQEGKGGTKLCSMADTVQEAAEEIRQRMQQAAVSAEGGDAEPG